MLQLTEKETEPELDAARINETINNFQQIITSAADKSFPDCKNQEKTGTVVERRTQNRHARELSRFQ